MASVDNGPLDLGSFAWEFLLQIPKLVGQSCSWPGFVFQVLLVSGEPLFECVACTSIVSTILIFGRHGSRVGESFSQAFSFNWAGGEPGSCILVQLGHPTVSLFGCDWRCG